MRTRRIHRRPAYMIAIDLGIAADPTGIVTLRARRGPTTSSPPLLEALQVERLPLGTEYRQVAAHLARLSQAVTDSTGKPPAVAIDGTGVGAGVSEIIDQALAPEIDLSAVVFTSGNEPSGDDRRMTVPKALLLTEVQLCLEQRRIEIWPEAIDLRHELAAFQGRTTATGKLTGEARAGATDDLVAALAIGIYVTDKRWRTAPVSVRSAANSSLPRRTGLRDWHGRRGSRY